MPDTNTVDVPIPVEARFAERLSDPELRARASMLINEMLRQAAHERLFAAIAALKEDAHRRGLTDETIDEELAAYNAERRDQRTPPQ